MAHTFKLLGILGELIGVRAQRTPALGAPEAVAVEESTINHLSFHQVDSLATDLTLVALQGDLGRKGSTLGLQSKKIGGRNC